MRLSSINILICLLYVGISAAGEVPATMRIDFFHTGNSESELFSLDQVVIEPLPWSGNLFQPVDTTLRGKYLFEISNRESARYADQVVAIHESGDSGQKVDLLLLGDGYTADEHDQFVTKAHELTNILFETSPFKERKNDFNVWALAPAATESGVSRPSTNTYRDSPIGATYDAFRSERYVLTFDNKKMRRVASSTPYDFIEILTNIEIESRSPQMEAPRHRKYATADAVAQGCV